VFVLPYVIIGHDARHSELLTPFYQVDELAVTFGVEGGQGGEEVDGFQDAGLPLGVGSNDEGRPGGEVDVQAGEVAELGEGEVGEIHFVISGHAGATVTETEFFNMNGLNFTRNLYETSLKTFLKDKNSVSLEAIQY
jgi:hypothetical protein